MKEIFLAQTVFISTEIIEWLNHQTFRLENWKWLSFLILIPGGLFVRPLIESIARKINIVTLNKVKNENFWTYLFSQRVERPITGILLFSSWGILIDTMELPPSFQKYSFMIVKILAAYNIIKLLYMSVDAFGNVLESAAAKTKNSMDDQLAPFATKALKVFTVVLGGLVVLQNLGINVTSLLAGLGIGGLAIALAAQDTAANVFGSITIIFDGPFRIGDWIKLGDIEGTVEEVGFRSTRVRTFYNSLITIPNSVIAKEKIDNMGARNQRRIRQNLGIAYETSPEKIESFCENIRYLITQIEIVVKDSIVVTFNNYTESNLNILMVFQIHTKDSNEELKIQQRLFCDILSLAKQMDVQFAYPTRTIIYRPQSEAKDIPLTS